MSNKALSIAFAAMVIAAMPAGQPARAYALEGQKWPSAKTSFAYVIPGRNANFAAAMKQALADWSAVTPFKYTPLNRSAGPCNTNAVNGAGFAKTACGQGFGSTTLAVTITTFTTANRYVHAGTVFNGNKNFSVYSGALKPNTTDFRRVAVHELGHALGLAHETKAGVKAIMQPLISNIEKPQPDDIAGVKKLY